MAKRPTRTPLVGRPPRILYILGVTGLASMVAAVIGLTQPTVVSRLLTGGPLLLMGLVFWAIAIMQFSDWATKLQADRARTAEQAEDEERHLALLETAGTTLIALPGVDLPQELVDVSTG